MPYFFYICGFLSDLKENRQKALFMGKYLVGNI